MAGKFEAQVQQLESFTHVKLSGIIDEDNELAALASRMRGAQAVIDLSGVRSINSCGVRDWLRWREALQARGLTVVLVECSPAIVASLNCVANFNSGGYIKSFYVPCYCAACDTEKLMLVDTDEFRGEGEIRAPTCRCDSCDGIMDFDDMEETYFSFLRPTRNSVLPEPVQKLMDQLAPAAGERKVVAGHEGVSLFDSIPSRDSEAEATGAGSASGISVASLRRLRDKTGLRTMRRPAPKRDTGAAPWYRTRLLLAIAVGALLLGGIAVLLLR